VIFIAVTISIYVGSVMFVVAGLLVRIGDELVAYIGDIIVVFFSRLVEFVQFEGESG